MKQQIEKNRKYVSYFPTVQILFLEIPCYSIEHYNKHLRCPNPENFHENDLILTERIGILNDHIRDMNCESGFSTPRFKKDLIKYRKGKGHKQSSSLKFSGYIDCLNPDSKLARTWMKKIVIHMLNACK